MPRDYFAEMYVAGILADSGWNIYFPRRDKGFDFIITKPIGDGIIVRPVQVKGKYPEVEGRNLPAYGYSGKLSQLHDDMVLAIAYFSTNYTVLHPTMSRTCRELKFGSSVGWVMLAIPRVVETVGPNRAATFGNTSMLTACFLWNRLIGNNGA